MLEKVKTFVEIVFLTATAIVFLFLVVHPQHLKNWCSRGGFDECKFFGNSYSPSAKQQLALQNAEQELGDAQSRLVSAQKMIDLLSKELSNLGGDTEAVNEANDLVSLISTASVEVDNSLGELGKVVTELAPMGRWIIVFGADRTLESAKVELDKLADKGPAKIFLRSGYYRTVLEYKSREEAENNLEQIRELSARSDSYLVNINNWCPISRVEQANDEEYVVCK